MKRKIMLFSLIIMLIAIAATGTYAYYIHSYYPHNIITTDKITVGVDGDIEEGSKEVSDDGGTTTWTVEGVMPTQTIDTEVSFSNNSERNCYMRVKIEINVTLKDGSPASFDDIGTVDILPEGWIKDGDWYYYGAEMSGGASTPVLLDGIHFSANMGNEYQECVTELVVTTQAVQADNNPIPDGGTTVDVLGWSD